MRRTLLPLLLLVLATACSSASGGGAADDATGPADAAGDDGGPGADVAPGDAADARDAGPDAATDGTVPTDAPADAPPDAAGEVAADTPGDAVADPGGTPPAGCCAPSGTCAGGAVCAPSAEAGFWTCVPPHDGSGCWSDAECLPAGRCKGAFVCPCGMTCEAAPSAPGRCKALADDCCTGYADCDTGELCAGVTATALGRCLPMPPPMTCYADADCFDPMKACSGAFVCPCEDPVCATPSATGTCVPKTFPDCCEEQDPSCPDGKVCFLPPASPYSGQCVDPPAAGECWERTDCSPPETRLCVGSVGCACQDPFCTAAKGACVAVRQCCGPETACLAGTCTHVRQQGTLCMPPPPAGGCWGDTDCAAGFACQGASVCTCDTVCDQADVAGTCVALPTGCCTRGADCGDGKVCVGADDAIPGRCLPALPAGGCYSQADCAPWPTGPWTGGEWCEYCIGGAFCPCVEACPDCGYACPEDKAGMCEVDGCI